MMQDQAHPRVELVCTAGTLPALRAAVDHGAILADPGLMEYAAGKYPQLTLHLSVQGSATNWRALEFYRREFGIRRAVLPRVLSATQVERLVERTDVEIEVFGFGSLCVMVEGRCALSSYVTGHSPNMQGVCSPAHAVRWEETAQGCQSRLNGVLIDRYASGEFVAGSANIEQLDPACSAYPIVQASQRRTLDTVMSNSFGFGGTNASLVFQRHE